MPERGSTQHSARMDDELERETESLVRGAPVESRADESRMMEAAAEGEPAPDAHISTDDVEQRSLLAISLRPSAFPGDRDALVAVAEEQFAEERVIEWLETLPEGVEFANVEAVWEALGGRRETREASEMMPQPRPMPPPVTRETARAPEPEPHEEPRAAVTAESPALPFPLSVVARAFALAGATVQCALGVANGAVREVRRRF